MQITTELRPMFSYSFIYIIIVILLLIFIYILTKYLKKTKIQKDVIIPSTKDIIKIKNNYLLLIQKLTDDFNNRAIDNRQAYQSLSNIIRNFVYEATNIKVQNYTLKEISLINMPVLTELVSEFYDPEFSKVTSGDIITSINKTKAVIEKWN